MEMEICRSPAGAPAIPGSKQRVSSLTEIDWVAYNYPPLMRLVHYDLYELPARLAGVVLFMNLSFTIVLATVTLNLVDMIVIVATTGAPIVFIFLSILAWLLLPPPAFLVFYTGYRGLAEPDSLLQWRYRLAQPCMGLVYIFMCLFPYGSSNGLLRLAHSTGARHDEVTGSTYWMFAVIAESILWLFNAILAFAVTWRAYVVGAGRPGRYEIQGGI